MHKSSRTSTFVTFLTLLLAFAASLAAAGIRWRYLIPSETILGNIAMFAPLVIILLAFIYHIVTRNTTEALGTLLFSLFLFFPICYINTMANFNVERAIWHTVSTTLPDGRTQITASQRSLYGGRWTWIPGPPGGEKMWKIELVRKDSLGGKHYRLNPEGGILEIELFSIGTGKGQVLKIHDPYVDHFVDLNTLKKTESGEGTEQKIGMFSWYNGEFAYIPNSD